MEAASRSRQSSIYGKSGSIARLSLPMHANQPLKRGLLGHLMKLAELTDQDLEA
jgi:hypothetical protein